MSVRKRQIRDHYIGTYISSDDARVIFEQCEKLNVSASKFMRLALQYGYHAAVSSLTKKVDTAPSIFGSE